MNKKLSKAGRIGGKVKNPNKGFGSNRELAKVAGAKGGRISRRKGIPNKVIYKVNS